MYTKKLKKLMTCLSVVLSMSLISSNVFAASTNTNAKNDDITNAKKYMLSIGLDSNFVNNAPDSEISKYFHVKLVSQSKKYFRVTYNQKDSTNNSRVEEIPKDIFDKEVSDYNASSTSALSTSLLNTNNNMISPMSSVVAGTNTNNTKSWLTMTVTSNIDTSTNKYLFTNACTWKTTPVFREKDVIAIGHDTHLAAVQNSAYFYSQTYLHDPVFGSRWVTNSSTSASKEDVGGIGFNWSLPADASSTGTDPFYYTDFYSYMSYSANQSQPGYGSYNIYGDYEHQQSGLQLTPSYSFPSGGSINLSLSNLYDPVNCLVSWSR